MVEGGACGALPQPCADVERAPSAVRYPKAVANDVSLSGRDGMVVERCYHPVQVVSIDPTAFAIEGDKPIVVGRRVDIAAPPHCAAMEQGRVTAPRILN